jgi:predicted ABC-type transport system involved in lysophospholipase L1 biosynthesis ATPase subunit
VSTPVLEVDSVAKQYGGLRPLRIERLIVPSGDRVALVGLDQAAAEALTALVTGVTLPDSGAVSLFGRSTVGIQDSDEWLTHVDRIGIVSERAVLLDSLTVVQNLSMPYTLEIEPPPDEVRQAATVLAAEAGVSEEHWDRPVARLDRHARLRVRLARALALDPRLLILEHPNASLESHQERDFASDLGAIATSRGLAMVIATADAGFAAAAAARVLVWEPASGRLRDRAEAWWRLGRR